MQEYVTEAVVLRKEPLRDLDARYSFFTKKFGKIVGKATSSRKITSKLAGHLEPGTVTTVRFVERNGGGAGTQIVDALKSGRVAVAYGDLELLNGLLADREPDQALWNELLGERFSWPAVLRILGWDPRSAACERCGKKAAAFYISRQEFFCVNCASKLRRDTLLLLGNG